jgi:alkylhydroperoxidase/carboxymuconolactone decarboxylase family protein
MPAYYQSEDLARFAEMAEGAPELWRTFQAWYGEVFQEGALSVREKALIALAVASAIPCPYCIDAYTRSSLENGSSLEQMTEALQVAAAIRGGATLIQGIPMKTIAEKLTM